MSRETYAERSFIWKLLSQVLMVLDSFRCRVSNNGSRRSIIRLDLKLEKGFLNGDKVVKVRPLGIIPAETTPNLQE